MFKFKLQTLLGYRKTQEEGKQRELAVVNMEQKALGEQLSALTAAREEKSEELAELGKHATDVRTIRLYTDFMDGCDADITWKHQEIFACSERVKQKQLELQEYVKRKRILEVYRERMLSAYTLREGRKERAFTDETATNIWYREAR